MKLESEGKYFSINDQQGERNEKVKCYYHWLTRPHHHVVRLF